MRALSATELLSVWERGFDQSPVQRGLKLLAVACPEVPPDGLAALSIGRRDARLLSLREQLFGSQLTSLTSCPACGERVELNFNMSDIRVAADPEAPETLTLKTSEYEIDFRLPNSLDLERLDVSTDTAVNRRRLLEQCVLTARRGTEEVPAGQLPEEIVRAIAERMEQADPQANMQLALLCPQCAHQWQAPLDIVSFLWSEIHAWAGRLLREVHALALAYGWRETDILALSPWRRQAYLELINP